MSSQADEAALPPRIVHLLGGLRAVDDRAGPIVIQVGYDRRLAQFPAPEYRNLYRDLRALALKVVGVEFVYQESLDGLRAPDWQCVSPEAGFKLRTERNLWTEVRHLAIKNADMVVRDLAERASTYLDLLNIRILQLSEAYGQSLRAFLAEGKADSIFFGNTFDGYVDAAIHAFVADAASFRDLIAEALWKLIVKGPGKVATMAIFRDKAKSHSHALVQSVVAASAPGGWLRSLSSLRNHITHAAPMERTAEFHMRQPRKVKIGPNIEAAVLHCPLLDAGGELRRDQAPVDFNDEEGLKARLEEYKLFCDRSIDALEFAWVTLGKLVDVVGELRVAAGLKGERLTLTKDDLAGEITFR